MSIQKHLSSLKIDILILNNFIELEIWYLNSEILNLNLRNYLTWKLNFEFQIIILDSQN